MWYIVALVTFLNGEQEVKFHEQIRFASIEECNSFYVDYETTLYEGIKRTFPAIDTASISCMNPLEIMQLQQTIKGKNLRED
mgnify:FL=1|tara:strand:+ start:663 stop:908 length:246 start_codon:yes stop_codon:yes gene_type:complete